MCENVICPSLLHTHIRGLTFSRLTMSIGFHFIQPTLAIIFLYPPFQFSTSQIGLALVLYNLADRGLAVFCAPLVDRLSPQKAQILGFLVTALALFFLCFTSQFFFVASLLIICGLGFSISSVGFRSAVGSIPDHNLRLKGYSDGSIGVCAGATIGYLIAFVLPYREMFKISFLLASLFIFISAVIVKYFTKCLYVKIHNVSFFDLFSLCQKKEGRQILQVGLKYILYSSSALIVYFAFFDLTPLYFEKSIGVPSSIGWIFAIASIFTVLFQRFATKLFGRIAKYWEDGSIMIGLIAVIFAAIIFSRWWSHEVAWFVSAILACTIVFVGPTTDYLISKHIPEEYHSYVFGLKITSSAVVRSLAVWAGTQYLSLASEYGWGVQYIWLLLAIVPTVVLSVVLYRRTFILQAKQRRMFMQENVS